MTVAELIHALGRMPAGKQVRVCPRSIIGGVDSDEETMPLCEDDAAEADEVRNEGAFILIWGGRP